MPGLKQNPEQFELWFGILTFFSITITIHNNCISPHNLSYVPDFNIISNLSISV